MTNHINRYTVALAPTPAQRKELQLLSWQSGLIRVLANDQAQLLAHGGQDFSLVELLDDVQDQPDRSPEGEARALQHVSSTRGAPHALLVAAILAGRDDYAAERTPRRIDCPHHDIEGVGLIRPVSADQATIAGVTGAVAIDVAALPRWAAQVWAQTAGAVPTLPDVNLTGVSIVNAHVSPVDDMNFEDWVMTVVYAWTAARAGG